MDWDSLILTPAHKADTIHLDPMETIWMKDVLVCGLQEVVATGTSEGALAVVGGGIWRR